MNLDYARIFDQRGGPYHAAMRAHPHARVAEFAQVFASRPLVAGQSLLDVPAGGGYLGRYLGPHVSVTPLEFTDGFSEDVPVVAQASAWPVGTFDHVVCLAALHHIPDRAGFAARLRAHVAPGGTLHVADVDAGSSICAFLDGFVGLYNGTGHAGVYLGADVEWLAAGHRVTRNAELACPWVFASRTEMVDFCMGLFGLQGCTGDGLLDALQRDVGVEESDAGTRLNWRLRYVDIALD